MPILIDGHNLIACLPGLSLADPDDEQQLIRRLMSYAARAGKRITVVFDPGETYSLSQQRRYGPVEVLFAGHGSEADAVLIRRVQRSRNPREWLVVTSDMELAARVERLGARTRRAEDFAAELGAGPGAEEKPQSAGDLEAWLALFGERQRNAGPAPAAGAGGPETGEG